MENESNDESGPSTSSTIVPQTPTKKRKFTKRLQKYKVEWEKQYVFISKDPQNEFNAKCIPCNITIAIGKSGIGQVSSFMSSYVVPSFFAVYFESILLNEFF